MNIKQVLGTKQDIIGYIGKTGQSFKVRPMHNYLTPSQKLDILIEDNPHLTISTIDILRDKLTR